MLYCTVGGLIGYSQSRVKKRKPREGVEKQIFVSSLQRQDLAGASGFTPVPRLASALPERHLSLNTVKLHLHRGSNCR